MQKYEFLLNKSLENLTIIVRLLSLDLFIGPNKSSNIDLKRHSGPKIIR